MAVAAVAGPTVAEVKEVITASDESLITDAERLIASWQQADDDEKPAGAQSDTEKSASDAESQEAAALKDAMSERDEEVTAEQAGGDQSNDSEDGGKFNTASMIGPMAYAPQLFSKLEIEQSFQGYAERVAARRTRDMDSPMHAPYTFEVYTWISPVFYHKPLYFEQPNLERYGQGTHRLLQPAASSVHFFGTIPLLPYKILTQHPCEKYYTLGNRRPGNCNPVQRRVILGNPRCLKFASTIVLVPVIES